MEYAAQQFAAGSAAQQLPVRGLAAQQFSVYIAHQFPAGLAAQQLRSLAEFKEAERRAEELLEAHIGSAAMAAINAGGGFPVPSKLWKGVVYLVPRAPHGRIKIVADGAIMAESCLAGDATLPWADLMLQRIQALQIDETVAFVTGVVHDRREVRALRRHARLLDKMRRILGLVE